jgi:hypothetical protein
VVTPGIGGDSTPVPRLSRRKRWLFAAVAVVLCAGAIELTSALAYRLAFGAWYSAANVRAVRREARAAFDVGTPGATVARRVSAEVVHPYVGYVLDPTDPRHRGISPDGFPSDPFVPRGAGELRVAVFGGSMAGMTAGAIEDALRRRLREGPAPPHTVRVQNLAFGGAKQPQQLMALTYLLALGARFDVVINLDGFNDVVLPVAENWTEGVSPIYPRGWSGRVGALAEPAALAAVGRATVLRDARVKWADVMDESIVSSTVFGNTVWALVDRVLQRRASGAEADARTATAAVPGFARTGPARPASLAETRRLVVDVWLRSSVQMHEVARASGARYVHVLQPNQYVPGSKVLTAEERRIAYRPDSAYGQAATEGYPLLIAAGPRLRAAGVSFTDATPVFATDARSLYIDDCCHLGPEGTRTLAGLIAARVADVLSR